jgi:prevent-host-death family protein
MPSKKIGAAKFKEQCLSILDNLEPDGIIVTKHGKPVARVVPVPHSTADLIGSLEGKIEVCGDIMSTGIEWESSAES